MTYRLLALAALTASLIAPPSLAEQVYRWVDDEGVTHFTAHPPKNRKSDQIRTQTGSSEPVDYSSQFAPPDTESNENEANQTRQDFSQEELDDACERARQNLQALEQGGRIAEESEDGSTRYLDEDEQADRAERARQMMEEAC